MKLIKQISAILGIILLFAAFDAVIYNEFTKRYINESSEEMQAKSIELNKYLPFDENSEIVRLESSLRLDGELPVVDGAAALYPVFSAFVNSVYPPSSVSFDGESFTKESKLHYTNTRGAYKALADGDADIIFCAKPSAEQLAYASEKNVEFEMIPIGHEAFVFLVNSANPIDGLSSEQVRKIYSGEYTNWSQAGGENRPIDALQRNKGSGSQTAMLSFMGDTEIKRSPFSFNGSAIGFSFRYYVEGIVNNGSVKMLSLDGVYPDKESIMNGSYPIIDDIYAIYDKSDPNENIGIFIEWILSAEGQKIIEDSGYVPLGK